MPTSYKLLALAPVVRAYRGGGGGGGRAARAHPSRRGCHSLTPRIGSRFHIPPHPHATILPCVYSLAISMTHMERVCCIFNLVWRRVCDGPRVVRTPCESRSAVLTAEGPLSRCGRAVAVRGPAHALRGPEARTHEARARSRHRSGKCAASRRSRTHVCSKLFDIELLGTRLIVRAGVECSVPRAARPPASRPRGRGAAGVAVARLSIG